MNTSSLPEYDLMRCPRRSPGGADSGYTMTHLPHRSRWHTPDCVHAQDGVKCRAAGWREDTLTDRRTRTGLLSPWLPQTGGRGSQTSKTWPIKTHKCKDTHMKGSMTHLLGLEKMQFIKTVILIKLFYFSIAFLGRKVKSKTILTRP